jgi:hypothetical protein
MSTEGHQAYQTKIADLTPWDICNLKKMTRQIRYCDDCCKYVHPFWCSNCHLGVAKTSRCDESSHTKCGGCVINYRLSSSEYRTEISILCESEYILRNPQKTEEKNRLTRQFFDTMQKFGFLKEEENKQEELKFLAFL